MSVVQFRKNKETLRAKIERHAALHCQREEEGEHHALMSDAEFKALEDVLNHVAKSLGEVREKLSYILESEIEFHLTDDETLHDFLLSTAGADPFEFSKPDEPA